jgi:hypothetical protein
MPEEGVAMSLVMLSRDLWLSSRHVIDTEDDDESADRAEADAVRETRVQEGVPIEPDARGLPCEQCAQWQGRMLRATSVPHSASFDVAAIVEGG